MFDANCLNSNYDVVLQFEGTGIRSGREFIARRTPVGNNQRLTDSSGYA